MLTDSEQLILLVKEGFSISEIAEWFDVCRGEAVKRHSKAVAEIDRRERGAIQRQKWISKVSDKHAARALSAELGLNNLQAAL